MEKRQDEIHEDAIQPIENIVQNTDEGMFTTSLIIAQAFAKEHKDVLKAISNLECSEEFHQRNFAPMVYEAEIGSGAKREFPAYRITRDGFAFLAMGFTGKKAAVWKEKFLEAFNAMERALMAREEEPALPPKEEEEMPRELALYFRPKRKITKGNVRAIHGLLHMEAYFHGISWEEAAERFCLREHIRCVEDLPQVRFIVAVNESFRTLFYVRKYPHRQEKSVHIQDALRGLMEFWNQMSSFSPQEVRNYVFNRCGIETMEEIENENAAIKALFVLWGGIANHTLKAKSC